MAEDGADAADAADDREVTLPRVTSVEAPELQGHESCDRFVMSLNPRNAMAPNKNGKRGGVQGTRK